RPLIVAGGPKAVYEPYHYWTIPGEGQPVAPDVVVTGETYVLLDLLNVLTEMRGRGESLRQAFERARLEGMLDSVPGLVYLAPGATLQEPVVIDTGLQRLVQNFDELPHEAVGLTLMEPPHRGSGLRPHPVPDSQVRRHVMIVSLLITQGCKFTCSYCPIPALNQKSWRFRSPEGLVEEMRSVHERFGVKYFFGTDDNFFNHRETAQEILTALARARTSTGRRLGDRIRFATEATQFDTYKNRDLLPLGREAGLHSIWFGIEDLTASLINKGQKPEITIELFHLMHQHKICPMAMIMFHEGQPFYSRGSLYGLFNQVEFLRKAGAISLQCTVHIPAVGTREYEGTYVTGRVIERVGRYAIPESKIDGNYVLVLGEEPAWKRQLQLLGGYAAFYNPWNLVRALKRDGSLLRRRRYGYQIVGQIATLWTAWKMLPYILRLMFGRAECHSGPPVLETVPVTKPEGAFPRMPQHPAPVSARPRQSVAQRMQASHV
ncbi:MAG: B12-binding domain-containing radical SAM protein, partial [Syntrophaceae bacterium]